MIKGVNALFIIQKVDKILELVQKVDRKSFSHSKATHSFIKKVNLIKYVRTKKRWPQRTGAI